MKKTNVTWREIELEEIGALDLQEEVLRVREYDPREELRAYAVYYDGNRGDMLYRPSTGRCGIALGGNASWYDASPDEVIDNIDTTENLRQ